MVQGDKTVSLLLDICLKINLSSLLRRSSEEASGLFLKFRLVLQIWGRESAWQCHSTNKSCANVLPASGAIGQIICVIMRWGIGQFFKLLVWCLSSGSKKSHRGGDVERKSSNYILFSSLVTSYARSVELYECLEISVDWFYQGHLLIT